jgi:tetratricopeptide (TPR) repeat protein
VTTCCNLKIFGLAHVFLAVLLGVLGCAPRGSRIDVTLGSPEHHFQAGMKLIDMGRYKDARREFETIEKESPAFPKSYVGLALISGYQGNLPEALGHIERAQTFAQSDSERACIQVGLIRLYTINANNVDGWLNHAESAYQTALWLDPLEPDVHYYMAQAYTAANRLENAEKLYRIVLELNRTHVREAKMGLQAVNGKRGTKP